MHVKKRHVPEGLKWRDPRKSKTHNVNMREVDFSHSQSKPNVLIIIATDIIGGPGKGLLQLLGNSNRLGFDYTLSNFNATYMTSGNHEFFKRAGELGISVHLIKQKWTVDPYVILRANRIMRKRYCNIIQSHGYKANIISFFLKMLNGIPWIAFAHGYTDDNRKIRTYNLLDSLVLRYADTVVAVSKSMKEFLIQKGLKSYKIIVIYNAVDKNDLIPSITGEELRKSLKIERRHPVIGIVGRLGPEKGHIVFLNAFRYVLKKFPHAKALIIGDGQEKGRLLFFCNKKNITRSVIFTGHVDNIANYYQIIDILVVPSFSEGLPNVLLEAMILGVPVVATSVGGIPEIVKPETGVLIPPGDHMRLGKEIAGLLQDRTKREMLSRNAEASIPTLFSTEKRAERIVHLYHTVLRS